MKQRDNKLIFKGPNNTTKIVSFSLLDGKSDYEIFKSIKGNENKTMNDFFSYLKNKVRGDGLDFSVTNEDLNKKDGQIFRDLIRDIISESFLNNTTGYVTKDLILSNEELLISSGLRKAVRSGEVTLSIEIDYGFKFSAKLVYDKDSDVYTLKMESRRLVNAGNLFKKENHNFSVYYKTTEDKYLLTKGDISYVPSYVCEINYPEKILQSGAKAPVTVLSITRLVDGKLNTYKVKNITDNNFQDIPGLNFEVLTDDLGNAYLNYYFNNKEINTSFEYPDIITSSIRITLENNDVIYLPNHDINLNIYAGDELTVFYGYVDYNFELMQFEGELMVFNGDNEPVPGVIVDVKSNQFDLINSKDDLVQIESEESFVSFILPSLLVLDTSLTLDVKIDANINNLYQTSYSVDTSSFPFSLGYLQMQPSKEDLNGQTYVDQTTIKLGYDSSKMPNFILDIDEDEDPYSYLFYDDSEAVDDAQLLVHGKDYEVYSLKMSTFNNYYGNNYGYKVMTEMRTVTAEESTAINFSFLVLPYGAGEILGTFDPTKVRGYTLSFSNMVYDHPTETLSFDLDVKDQNGKYAVGKEISITTNQYQEKFEEESNLEITKDNGPEHYSTKVTPTLFNNFGIVPKVKASLYNRYTVTAKIPMYYLWDITYCSIPVENKEVEKITLNGSSNDGLYFKNTDFNTTLVLLDENGYDVEITSKNTHLGFNSGFKDKPFLFSSVYSYFNNTFLKLLNKTTLANGSSSFDYRTYVVPNGFLNNNIFKEARNLYIGNITAQRPVFKYADQININCGIKDDNQNLINDQLIDIKVDGVLLTDVPLTNSADQGIAVTYSFDRYLSDVYSVTKNVEIIPKGEYEIPLSNYTKDITFTNRIKVKEILMNDDTFYLALNVSDPDIDKLYFAFPTNTNDRYLFGEDNIASSVGGRDRFVEIDKGSDYEGSLIADENGNKTILKVIIEEVDVNGDEERQYYLLDISNAGEYIKPVASVDPDFPDLSGGVIRSKYYLYGPIPYIDLYNTPTDKDWVSRTAVIMLKREDEGLFTQEDIDELLSATGGFCLPISLSKNDYTIVGNQIVQFNLTVYSDDLRRSWFNKQVYDLAGLDVDNDCCTIFNFMYHFNPDEFSCLFYCSLKVKVKYRIRSYEPVDCVLGKTVLGQQYIYIDDLYSSGGFESDGSFNGNTIEIATGINGIISFDCALNTVGNIDFEDQNDGREINITPLYNTKNEQIPLSGGNLNQFVWITGNDNILSKYLLTQLNVVNIQEPDKTKMPVVTVNLTEETDEYFSSTYLEAEWTIVDNDNVIGDQRSFFTGPAETGDLIQSMNWGTTQRILPKVIFTETIESPDLVPNEVSGFILLNGARYWVSGKVNITTYIHSLKVSRKPELDGSDSDGPLKGYTFSFIPVSTEDTTDITFSFYVGDGGGSSTGRDIDLTTYNGKLVTMDFKVNANTESILIKITSEKRMPTGEGWDRNYQQSGKNYHYYL